MTNIIIIGGGVMGLMTARELLAAGAKVCLFDRQVIGRESSWAGGGIIAPLYPWRTAEEIIRLWLWSHAAYPSLSEALQMDTGIDPEWTLSGLLVLDCENEALAGDWCSDRGVVFESLNPLQARKLEPALWTSAQHPVYLPEIAQVRNPRLLAALRADVLRRGGQIIERQAVTGITAEQGRVTAVRTDQKAHAADAYVVTLGAWTGEFDRRSVGLDRLQVEPVKGQMIVFAAEPGLLKHIVLEGGHYLIPRQDGRILVGSTLENTGFDKSISDDARAELRSFACRLLPELENLPVEHHWAGLRPGSPTGIPYIGPHPEIGNLYVNCGHYRNGFVMAPASARLVGDLILGRSPPLPPDPYALPPNRRNLASRAESSL